MRNGKPLLFGSVKITVRNVSDHLMPVCVEPELLAPLSGALRRRMQGKSCFNFTRVDPALFAELGELTRRGYAYYVAEGCVPGP